MAEKPYSVGVITISDNDRIFTNKDGSKSIMAAHVRIALAAGLAFSATVYADASIEGKVKYRASMPGPKSGMSFDSDFKLDAINAVNDAVASWADWQAARKRAIKVLSAKPKAKGATAAGLDDEDTLDSPEAAKPEPTPAPTAPATRLVAKPEARA